MPAFSAAKRTALTLVGLVFLLSAPLALADNHTSGYLGVMLQEISPSMAKALQLDGKSGIMINNVVKDSPAARAGLEDGDIILKFKGDTVETTRGFTKAVRATAPGEEVEMVILHDGKKQSLKVELGENEQDVSWFSEGDGEDLHFQVLKDIHEDMDWDKMDDEHEIIIKKMREGQDGHVAFFSQNDRGFMGVHLDEIEGQMAKYFEVDGGALITEVNEDSPADKAGLKAGDVIVKIDDMEVGDEADLHKAMQDTKPDQEVKVQVVRKGDKKTMKVTLGEMPESSAYRNIEVFTDGDHMNLRAPRMLFHGKGHGNGHGNSWTVQGDELESLREELQEMKKELKEMKKELKK